MPDVINLTVTFPDPIITAIQIAGFDPVIEMVTLTEVGALQVLENRTTDPVAPMPGRIWLRTDL